MIKKLKITLEGKTYDVVVEEVEESASADTSFSEPAKTATVYSKPIIEVKSPLGGTVYSVAVKTADEVNGGDCLCVIEYTSVRNNVTAPMTGTIHSVKVKPGDNVEEGTVLFTITE